jgi:hydrogenase assembly chaperone HypC/HupF
MCLTVPCRVVAVDGLFAEVERGDARIPVALTLLDDPPAVGDWVAVQSQRYAVSVLTATQAAEALALLERIAGMGGA